MSVDVHPAPPSGPLTVPAGTPGDPVSITERTAVDPVTGRTTMCLRIVQIDDGSPTVPPGIRLSAGTGPLTDLRAGQTPISSGAGVAALAAVTAVPDGVQLVQIEIVARPGTWRMQIVNHSARQRRYVWTVADSAEATRQPWLDVPEPVHVDIHTGDAPVDREVAVINHGPGPLTLTDPDGTDLGSGFTLRTVSSRTVLPNRGTTAVITFTPPATAADLATTRVLGSDDRLAGPVLGHDNRLQLTAAVHTRPGWEAGDILAIHEDGGIPNLSRLDRAAGELVVVTPDLAGAVDLAVDPATGDALVLGLGWCRRVDRLSTTLTYADVPISNSPIAVAGGSEVVVAVLWPDQMYRRIGPEPDFWVADLDLPRPRNAAVEPNGGVLIIDSDRAEIIRFGPATTGPGTMTRSTVASGGHLLGPVGGPVALTVAGDGTILAAVPSVGGAGTLVRVHPGTGGQTVMETSQDFADPMDLATAADGSILVVSGKGVFAIDLASGNRTRLLDHAVHAIAGA